MSILALLTGIVKALGIALGLVERRQIEGAGRAKEQRDQLEAANEKGAKAVAARAAVRAGDPAELHADDGYKRHE